MRMVDGHLSMYWEVCVEDHLAVSLFWELVQKCAPDLKHPKSEPPNLKRGRKTGAARKLSKSVDNMFDTF